MRDNSDLVTVIVPVYNAEKYIKTCLDSILSQTYEKLEIIIVDDGSKDRSGSICREKADEDSRITIISKENEGVSAARNDALKLASGKYVVFVDADDYIEKDYVERLYFGLIESNADISICGLEKVNEIGKKELKNMIMYEEHDTLVDYENLWFNVIDTNLLGSYMCNKMFLRKSLEGIFFDEKVTIGEDMLFLAQYMKKVSSAYFVAKPLYKYRIHQASAFNSISKRMDEASILAKIESNLLVAESLWGYVKDESENIKSYVAYRNVRTVVWCELKMIISEYHNNELFKKFKSRVKDNFTGYRNVDFGTKQQDLVVAFMLLSPRLVYWIGRIACFLFPAGVEKLVANN